jgi:hypothetical protein
MTDYQPLLARALKGLDRNTSEARRAVYDRARQALLNQLRSANPPMADADITRERLALEDAIRKTETEAVLAEPHSVRTPGAARSPAAPRPAAPSPTLPAPPPLRAPAQPRIPMPPKPEAASFPTAAPQPRADHVPSPGVEKSQPPIPSGEPVHMSVNAPVDAPPASPVVEPEVAAPVRPSPPVPSAAPPPVPQRARRGERMRPPPPRGPEQGGAQGARGNPPPVPPHPQSQPQLQPRPRARPPHPNAPVGRDPAQGRDPRVGQPVRVPPAKSGKAKYIISIVLFAAVAAAGVFAFLQRGRILGTATAPSAPAVTDGESPKSSERITQSADGHGPAGTPGNLDPAVAQRAVLYEENPGGGQQFQNFVGTAVWKTEAVNNPGRAPDLGLRIEVEIPERKINVTLKMRRNTDPSFPASHTIEVIFDVPPGDAFGGITDMRGIRAKSSETAQGTPIAAEVQKVKDGYFLLALPQIERDNNLSMLRSRDWLDIPFVYANGRRAVLTFQKGTPGERALHEVLNSWGQGQSQGQ